MTKIRLVSFSVLSEPWLCFKGKYLLFPFYFHFFFGLAMICVKRYVDFFLCEVALTIGSVFIFSHGITGDS